MRKGISRDLVLLGIIGFALFMATGMTGTLNSLYAEFLGAGYVSVGLLGTVSSLTTILFAYLWGRTSDELGQRKTILLLGLGIFGVSYVLVALASDYRVLFALRAFGAIGQAAYGASSLALMGDLLDAHPRVRGRRMGIYRGLCSLGFGLMAFLSGSIADRLTLRAPFGLAAFFLFAAFCVGLGLGSDDVRQSGLSFGALRRVVRGLFASGRSVASALWRRLASASREAAKEGRIHRGYIGRLVAQLPTRSSPVTPLLISAFLWSLVTGAVYAVWANYMVGQVGYETAAMSRLWALASLSEFPLMIAAGWLSDRIGRLQTLGVSFVVWTLVFGGYAVLPVMPWIIGIQLLRGFAYSSFTATAMTYATEVRAKSLRGQTSGLYNSASALGAIVGATMGGTLAEFAGFRAMFTVNAVLICLGAAYLAVAALRHGRRSVVVPTPAPES